MASSSSSSSRSEIKNTNTIKCFCLELPPYSFFKNLKKDMSFLTTIGMEMCSVTWGDTKFIINIRAGLERFQTLHPKQLGDAKVILLCPKNQEELKQLYTMVEELVKDDSLKFFIVKDSTVELTQSFLPCIETTLFKDRSEDSRNAFFETLYNSFFNYKKITKKEQLYAFVSGLHPFLGENSSISALTGNPLYESKVIGLIASMLPDSQSIIEEKPDPDYEILRQQIEAKIIQYDNYNRQKLKEFFDDLKQNQLTEFKKLNINDPDTFIRFLRVPKKIQNVKWLQINAIIDKKVTQLKALYHKNTVIADLKMIIKSTPANSRQIDDLMECLTEQKIILQEHRKPGSSVFKSSEGAKFVEEIEKMVNSFILSRSSKTLKE